MAVTMIARGMGLAIGVTAGGVVIGRNAVCSSGLEAAGGGFNRRGESEHGDGQRKQRCDPAGPEPLLEHASDYHLWVDDQ